MGVRTIAINPRRSDKQTRAFIQECPLPDYDSLTHEDRLEQLVVRINATADEDTQRRLKGMLPFRSPHYTRFRDNYRDREHIDAESFTWQTCIDIDDKDEVDRAIARARELNAEPGGMWQDMLLHMDHSARHKLHIDIRLPLGMTVAEAQRAYCKALGVACDTSCFTPERFIYVSPASHEIYRSEGWYEQLSNEEVARRRKAYTDRGLTIDGRTADGRQYAGAEAAEAELNAGTDNPTAQAGSYGLSQEGEQAFPDKFKGIPYADIIAEYWRRHDGEPQQGERNNRLHSLATSLRSVCDNNEAWLLQVMPRFGLSEQEMRAIVHSACKEPTKGSRLIDSIVAEISRQRQQAEQAEIPSESAVSKPAEVPMAIYRRLPKGLKESLVGVPPSMQMPVLCAVMPIAAAYADEVEVEYCDGMRQRLGLMSIIRGEQASGKSVCKSVIDIWKQQMEAEDAKARQVEEDWKERKKGRKANEKAPDDPKVLIRMVPVTISCSTLLKRLKNSLGHCLYSFCEELDTLRKTNGAGSWSSKYDIYRLSFDNGEWGQDYNSDMAESGMVNVAYNWTMLSTNGALHKCFKKENIENGLSSRVLVAEMPDASFSKMPKYTRRSDKDVDTIQQAVTTLRGSSGFVDTPRLRKAIEVWVEEKRQEASKEIDLVKDTFRKRSAVIGFRCGVVFHLLSGKEHETKMCQEFAVMMAQYCLDEQMKAFGNELQKAYASAQEERYTVNHSVFDRLPTTFTKEHLFALKQGFCGGSGLRTIILRWTRDGWIEKIDSKHWRKMLTADSGKTENVTLSHCCTQPTLSGNGEAEQQNVTLSHCCTQPTLSGNGEAETENVTLSHCCTKPTLSGYGEMETKKE